MNPTQLNLNPLSQIDPIVIIAVAVIFIATYVALRKVFVLPYLAVMEQRERLLGEADEQIRQAEELLRAADLDAETALTQAAQSAEELRAQARERADEYRRAKVDEATRAASERLERGRAEIAAARDTELAQLRGQAIECVGIACTQLVGAPDREAIEAAVDRLMARRVH